MKVLKIDRGSVEIDINGEVLSVSGEAMMPLPKPQLSEYVVYKDSFKWKNHNCDLNINHDVIFEFLREEFFKRNLKLIIE